MIKWQDRIESGLRVTVHRWKDEDPGQWVWSCYALGVDHRPIGIVRSASSDRHRRRPHRGRQEAGAGRAQEHHRAGLAGARKGAHVTSDELAVWRATFRLIVDGDESAVEARKALR